MNRGLIKLEIHISTAFLSCTSPLIQRWNKYDMCTVRNQYIIKPNKSSPNWRKNLPKLEEDTLSAPATMLVNLFSVSQLILKIYAWAVPKMPHFGENNDIWLRYWPSKLKSRFLGTSFSRLTFLKSGGDPVYIWSHWTKPKITTSRFFFLRQGDIFCENGTYSSICC